MERVVSVDDGRCRFNCRTARENWLEGFKNGIIFVAREIEELNGIEWDSDDQQYAEEAYREWKRQRT